MASSKLISFSDASIGRPEEVLVLDIPLPPHVKGLLVYDGTGKQVYKQPADQEFSDGQRKKFQSLLDEARMIVGFSINSDLQVLEKAKMYLYDDVYCIDLHTTFTYMLNQGVVPKKEMPDCTLKKIAEYFDFDAAVVGNQEELNVRMKWKIFDEMTKRKGGFLAKMTPKIKSLRIRKLEADVPESEWIDITDEAPVEPDEESAVGKIVENQGFYETLLPDGGDYIIVRMSEAEYALFLQIQNCCRDYTVKLFYETVLKPGILQRLMSGRE